MLFDFTIVAQTPKATVKAKAVDLTHGGLPRIRVQPRGEVKPQSIIIKGSLSAHLTLT